MNTTQHSLLRCPPGCFNCIADTHTIEDKGYNLELFNDISWRFDENVEEAKNWARTEKCTKLDEIAFKYQVPLTMNINGNYDTDMPYFDETEKTIMVIGTVRNVLQSIREAFEPHKHQSLVEFHGIGRNLIDQDSFHVRNTFRKLG